MTIAISGTPCTGKTSTATLLADNYRFKVINLNQEIKDCKLYENYDQGSESYVIDIETLINSVDDIIEQKGENKNLIIEGHLAHHLPQAELLFVLRTHPAQLKQRMKEKRWSEEKIDENLQAEALDLILQEAIDERGDELAICEINTTKRNAAETAEIIKGLVAAERGENTKVDPEDYRPGQVDWSSWLASD